MIFAISYINMIYNEDILYHTISFQNHSINIHFFIKFFIILINWRATAYSVSLIIFIIF